MRSSQIIHLVLHRHSKPTPEGSTADRLRRLNRQAAVLYVRASRQAGRDFSPVNYLIKEQAAIEACVTAELMPVNLVHDRPYQALVNALQAWRPLGNDRGSRLAQIIRKAMIDILPKIRQRQQLQAICQRYQTHLHQAIEVQLQADHPQVYQKYFSPQKNTAAPGSDFRYRPESDVQPEDKMTRFVNRHPEGMVTGNHGLNTAIEKYATVQRMSQTLLTEQPVATQIRNFKQVFEAQRSVIELDRDSLGIKFIKAVASVLSFGVAVWCGLWNIKGKQAAGHLNQALVTPSPLLGVRS